MPSFRGFLPRLDFTPILFVSLIFGLLIVPVAVCAQDTSAASANQNNSASSSGGAAGAGAQSNALAGQNPDRAKALELFKDGKCEDALPMFQSLAAATPNDPLIQEGLGACLVAHAATLPDADARRQVRIAARGALLRAKALGDNSNYLNLVLPKLPEDGSEPAYSSRQDVDNAIRSAEAAFSKGDMDGALAGYQQVLQLDPQNYLAMLYSGDV